MISPRALVVSIACFHRERPFASQSVVVPQITILILGSTSQPVKFFCQSLVAFASWIVEIVHKYAKVT
jgi:hypothetical protein